MKYSQHTLKLEQKIRRIKAEYAQTPAKTCRERLYRLSVLEKLTQKLRESQAEDGDDAHRVRVLRFPHLYALPEQVHARNALIRARRRIASVA